MIFLLFVAIVISTPVFIAEDGYDNLRCDGDMHFTEYSLLGMCRHRNDHSEKTTYHSSIQAEASFFSDKDCSGESRDSMVDLGCHRHHEQEWEKYKNMTYYDDTPQGTLNLITTTDKTCTTDFEGGIAYYPAQGVCTKTGRSRYHVNSVKYTCNDTYVTMDFYFDPDCESHSHQYDLEIGCNEDKEIPGLFVDVVCLE